MSLLKTPGFLSILCPCVNNSVVNTFLEVASESKMPPTCWIVPSEAAGKSSFPREPVNFNLLFQPIHPA